MKSKTDLLKFSLREAMRGGDFDYKEFIHDMKILDQEILILDLSPPSYKFGKNMLKNSLPVSRGFPHLNSQNHATAYSLIYHP